MSESSNHTTTWTSSIPLHLDDLTLNSTVTSKPKDTNPFQSNSLVVLGSYLVHLVLIEGPFIYQWQPTPQCNAIKKTKPASFGVLRNKKCSSQLSEFSIASSHSSTQTILPSKRLKKKRRASTCQEILLKTTSERDFQTYISTILEWVKDCVYKSLHHDIYPLKNLIFDDGKYQLFLERTESNFFKKYSIQSSDASKSAVTPCFFKYTAILCPIRWRKKMKTPRPTRCTTWNPQSSFHPPAKVCTQLEKRSMADTSCEMDTSMPTPIQTSSCELLCTEFQWDTHCPQLAVFPELSPVKFWNALKEILQELKYTMERKPSFDSWDY